MSETKKETKKIFGVLKGNQLVGLNEELAETFSRAPGSTDLTEAEQPTGKFAVMVKCRGCKSKEFCLEEGQQCV